MARSLLDLLRVGRPGDPLPCRLGLHHSTTDGYEFDTPGPRVGVGHGCARRCQAVGWTIDWYTRQADGTYLDEHGGVYH